MLKCEIEVCTNWKTMNDHRQSSALLSMVDFLSETVRHRRDTTDRERENSATVIPVLAPSKLST